MNKDDIIRELGWTMRLVTDDELFDRIERIVRLAVDDEREQCARVCESSIIDQYINLWNDACQSCADDIRARGEV